MGTGAHSFVFDVWKVVHRSYVHMHPHVFTHRCCRYKLPATDNIDPNPQNCAAITVWTTSTGVIGVLVRIELKDQACRVTVRAPNDTAAPIVAAALCAMLALC